MVNNLDFRDETIAKLLQFGIDDSSAWKDWLSFSKVQEATCLAVSDDSVKRFKAWRVSRNPDDAWS